MKPEPVVPPSEEIKLKRQAMGATPRQFAQMLGLRDSELSADRVVEYEKGRKSPTPAQLIKLAKLPYSPPLKSDNTRVKFQFIERLQDHICRKFWGCATWRYHKNIIR